MIVSETGDVNLQQIRRVSLVPIHGTNKILKFKKLIFVLFCFILSVIAIKILFTNTAKSDQSLPIKQVKNNTNIRGGQADLSTDTNGNYVKQFKHKRSYLHEKEMLLLLNLSAKHLQISKLLSYNDSIDTIVIQNVGTHTFNQLFTERRAVKIYNNLWDQSMNTLHQLHSIEPPVIHNDIKPNNLVADSLDLKTLSIIDFGSAYSDAIGKTFSGNLISGPSFYGSCWSRNFILMVQDTCVDNITILSKIRTQFGMYADEYSMAAMYFEYLFFVRFESLSWSEMTDDIDTYRNLYNLKIGQQYLRSLKKKNVSKGIFNTVEYLAEYLSDYRNNLFYEIFMELKSDQREEPELYNFMIKLQPYILRGFHSGEHAWIEIRTMSWKYYQHTQLGCGNSNTINDYLVVVKKFKTVQECENEKKILSIFSSEKTRRNVPIAHVIVYNDTNDPNYNIYQCPKLWLQYVGDITFNEFVQKELSLMSLNDATFTLIEYWDTLSAGLKVIHNYSIIHNDITSNNIIISHDRNRIHFIDFGCAIAYDDMTFFTSGMWINVNDLCGYSKYYGSNYSLNMDNSFEDAMKAEMYTLSAIFFEDYFRSRNINEFHHSLHYLIQKVKDFLDYWNELKRDPNNTDIQMIESMQEYRNNIFNDIYRHCRHPVVRLFLERLAPQFTIDG